MQLNFLSLAPDRIRKSFLNPSFKNHQRVSTNHMTFKRTEAYYNKARKRILFVNPGVVCKELFQESKFSQNFKSILFTWDKKHVDLVKYIKRLKIKKIVIESSGQIVIPDHFIQQLVSARLEGLEIYDSVAFYEKITGRTPIVHLSADWYLNDDIFSINTSTCSYKLKRAFDIAISLTLIPFASFFVLLGALGIKLSSKGPILFKQARIGRGGVPFIMFKLRTMRINSTDKSHTVKNDARITRVGKILRLTKIDELPQLVNILRGEMSLIGPRPEQHDIVEQFKIENPYYDLRHIIRPGVTGWAQVNRPKATPLENLEKLEYDLFYVKNLSPIIDARIFYKTIKVIMTLDSN
ncbi:lipopolysaccharide/colanic/teichoic acid biosynthesis glycosyltransferase [Pedobacter sp. AK017]|uniref:sugar transferase n=1 Tax=Pedobacter sp. AK017 TaxID=2723073 RepID=UPI00161E2842|nr:sugar transferase [Pedobacter sp. AK017]MBB5441387.1 lipopolysaccharide/colanic/teichoic acid biosynthesis glycosyltransferase [Pedobacter sp. AK017]